MRHVVLKGGMSVALEALELAWALEDRGYTFRLDGEMLIVGGASVGELTVADREALQLWKSELIRIVTYEVPDGMLPV